MFSRSRNELQEDFRQRYLHISFLNILLLFSHREHDSLAFIFVLGIFFKSKQDFAAFQFLIAKICYTRPRVHMFINSVQILKVF